MTDLTEQLYAGTLPTGHYYFNNGVETYIVLYSNANTKDRKMQEPSGLTVISEVPSYDEWQASEKYNKHLEEKIKIYERKDKQATETSIAYNELLEENTKLKTENKWYSEQLNEAVIKIDKLKEQKKLTSDCKTLAQTLLKVSPELRGWLEVNYGEYL